MKKQAEDWIFLADKDLYAAEVLLKDDYPLTNIVAFHCQQTIEKYLKAFLIENDVLIVKTHDLGMKNKKHITVVLEKPYFQKATSVENGRIQTYTLLPYLCTIR